MLPVCWSAFPCGCGDLLEVRVRAITPERKFWGGRVASASYARSMSDLPAVSVDNELPGEAEQAGASTTATDPSPAGSSSAHAAAIPPSDRPALSDRFEALLCDLRSENPSRRIPAVRLARDQRLQDPAHVGAIVAMWQQAENEHVRAGAGEVLVAVAPQLMAPHLAAVIDSLADPSQFARLAAVGILQKMQGHGLLPQEVPPPARRA